MGKNSINGIQIRVFVPKNCVKMLKERAKEFHLSLEHYAGLYLSGYRIIKAENKETMQY